MSPRCNREGSVSLGEAPLCAGSENLYSGSARKPWLLPSTTSASSQPLLPLFRATCLPHLWNHSPQATCKALPPAVPPLPHLFSLPLPLLEVSQPLLLLSFRVWLQPPSLGVFSALRQSGPHASAHGHLLGVLPHISQACAERAGVQRAPEKGAVSSPRLERPPPPALVCFSRNIKPSAQVECTLS